MLKAVIFDMDGVIIDSEPMHTRAAEGYIVVPYIIDLMKSLHTHGMKLLIASSSVSNSIKEVMESLHIKEYFNGYISGMQVANPKPSPDIFLAAAKQLQVTSDECIVIEDSTNGVNAAASAGMACIGFVNPNSGKQDLRKATILVEGFDEVDYAFVNQVYQYAHLEPATILTTDRLIIKELSYDDIDCLYQIYQNPEINTLLDDFTDSLKVEKEKHKSYIENVYHFYGFGLWGVFLRENQQLIGRCGIELKILDGVKAYEIGYLIDKNFQGCGYASESVEAVIDYAFNKLDVPQIIAIIEKTNLRSIRLAKKAGMVQYGECIRNHRSCFQYVITK